MSFIFLDRTITSHPLWSDKPYARGQAWVDLLFMARFKPCQTYIRGIRVDLKRGELAMAQEVLADRWGWSRGKVARFLDDMEHNSEIDRRQYNRIDIITICKYDEYQTKQATGDTTDGRQTDIERTSDGAHNKESIKKGRKVTLEEWEAKNGQLTLEHIPEFASKYGADAINHLNKFRNSCMASSRKYVDFRRAISSWDWPPPKEKPKSGFERAGL